MRLTSKQKSKIRREVDLETGVNQPKSAIFVNKNPLAEIHNRTQEYVDGWSLAALQDRLEELYGEMEQEAEPEGGPIADQYADEITFIEDAIRIKKYGKKEKKLTYDQAIGREEITDETGTYTMGKDGVKNYTKITPMTRDEFEKSSQFDRMEEADMTKNPSPEYVSKILQMHGKSKEEADAIVGKLQKLGKKEADAIIEKLQKLGKTKK